MSEYLRFLVKEKRYLSYGMLHLFFSGPGQTFFISLFLPWFAEVHQLGRTEFGTMYAGATLLSAGLMSLLGATADKYPLRNVSIFAGLGLALSCVVTAWAPNHLTLFLGLAGLRVCGQGMLPHLQAVGLARKYSARRGLALSLSGAGISLSEALLPMGVLYLVGMLGYSHALITIALFILLLFIPGALYAVPRHDDFHYNREDEPAGTTSHINHAAPKKYYKDAFLWLSMPAANALPFLLTGFFLHQSDVAAGKIWSPAVMASAFVTYGTVRLFFGFASGPLVDKYTAKRVFALHLLPLAIGLLCLWWATGPWAAHVFMSCCGLSMGLGAVSKNAMWAEVYGTGNLGALKGFLSTVFIVSTALAPPLFGYFFDNMEGLSTLLPITLLYCLCATGLYAWGMLIKKSEVNI